MIYMTKTNLQIMIVVRAVYLSHSLYDLNLILVISFSCQHLNEKIMQNIQYKLLRKMIPVTKLWKNVLILRQIITPNGMKLQK
jgi:hypothetical protein